MNTVEAAPRTCLGSVTLVGAGPGDPELLTIKAVRAIRRATLLLVDELVGDEVLRYARRSAGRCPCGKPESSWAGSTEHRGSVRP